MDIAVLEEIESRTIPELQRRAKEVASHGEDEAKEIRRLAMQASGRLAQFFQVRTRPLAIGKDPKPLDTQVLTRANACKNRLDEVIAKTDQWLEKPRRL
jgi:hypothetical protein